MDWLRVFAFGLLILYHASVAFFPHFHWLINSPQTSETLARLMDHPRGWRLALLFFISGMGTWYAFRGARIGDFLHKRLIRLMLPLLFAMYVFVVPQVWYERMWSEGYDQSLATFWLTRYFAEGRYPQGQFTWAHLWFVAYLFVMSVLAAPLFALIESRLARPVMAKFRALAASRGIYLLFLLPLAFNLALSPWFPRQTNVLYNDAAWFATWMSWFGLGYLIARDHALILPNIVARRRESLAAALVLSLALYLLAFTPVVAPIGDYDNATVAFRMLLMPFAWAMILALVGYFALYLNRPAAFLTWANNGVFAFYIIHQTIVVAALYYVLPWQTGMWPKYLAVLSATVIGSVLFYEFARRLPAPLQPLLGVQPPPAKRAAVKAPRLEAAVS